MLENEALVMNGTLKEVARRIKAVREDVGFTPAEIAERTEVSLPD